MSAIEGKMDKLLEKIKDGREDQIAEVVSLKKTLKAAMLKKNIKEHPALLQLLNLLRKREQSYSLLLANKEDLTDVQRMGMFEARRECRFILSFFDSADRTIEGIEKQLDFQLSEDTEPVDN